MGKPKRLRKERAKRKKLKQMREAVARHIVRDFLRQLQSPSILSMLMEKQKGEN